MLILSITDLGSIRYDRTLLILTPPQHHHPMAGGTNTKRAARQFSPSPAPLSSRRRANAVRSPELRLSSGTAASPVPRSSSKPRQSKRESASSPVTAATVRPPCDSHELYCDGSKFRPTCRGFMHSAFFITAPIWAFVIFRECGSRLATAASALYMLGCALEGGFMVAFVSAPAPS